MEGGSSGCRNSEADTTSSVAAAFHWRITYGREGSGSSNEVNQFNESKHQKAVTAVSARIREADAREISFFKRLSCRYGLSQLCLAAAVLYASLVGGTAGGE